MSDKTKVFDLTQESFKKIYTENGINDQALVEFIDSTMQLLPDEEKSCIGVHLMFHIVNRGAYNDFEALGMFEAAKTDYIRACENAAIEEENEDK